MHSKPRRNERVLKKALDLVANPQKSTKATSGGAAKYVRNARRNSDALGTISLENAFVTNQKGHFPLHLGDTSSSLQLRLHRGLRLLLLFLAVKLRELSRILET